MVAFQNLKGEIIQLILSRKGGACTLYAQLPLNDLLYFYETLHSCSTQPVDVHEGIPLEGEIIQLILSRKGGHVPCKRNSY